MSKLIDLVKSSCGNDEKLQVLENICDLCEKLRYSFNIDEMILNVYNWLYKIYDIKDMIFSLADIDKNVNCIILKKGNDFFLDDKFVFYFVIDTHTHFNAIVAFKANSQKHYNNLKDNYNYLETLFFQISPVLQNGVLKKLHLDSSSVDSVTHVYNRKYLLEYIHKTISLSNETEDNITFLMIGIDRFKAVIDEFDYNTGDKVLVELAKVIHSNIKEKDIVARLTGDEFLVALLDVSSEDIIKSIAQRIIEQFAKVEIVANEESSQILKKTICIGISSYPKDSDNIEDVIKNADKFLEEARNKGRSRYSIYNKDEDNLVELF